MISVIIPVKNGAETIAAAIESAIRQADEIIVVDDGSTDNLDDVLSSYDVILIRNLGNHGPGPARNFGLENAKGDFILFLDADDRLGANQIQFLLDALTKSKAEMAWCPTLFRTPSHSRIIFPQDWLEFFLVGECLPVHSMLFRHEKCFRFSDEFHFEDREWQSRMLISGMKVVSTPKTCCLYDWSGPKERYRFFSEENIQIRTKMIDWLGEKCLSRYAHANLYGCLQETFRWGMKVPEASIRLLARAFAMLPVSGLDRRDPYYEGIIQWASRLWHDVQEHPLLEKTLARLPKPERKIAVRPQPISFEIRNIAQNLFPDVFSVKQPIMP